MAGPRNDSNNENEYELCLQLLELAQQCIVVCANIIKANDQSKAQVFTNGYKKVQQYLGVVGEHIDSFKEELVELKAQIDLLKKSKPTDKDLLVRQEALLTHMKDLEKLKDKSVKGIVDLHKTVTKDFDALASKMKKDKGAAQFFASSSQVISGNVDASKKVSTKGPR